MALIIEGMKIPADCCDCEVRDHEYGECQILGRRTHGIPPRDCPIKGEIPDKHGELVEKTAITEKMLTLENKKGEKFFAIKVEDYNNLPVILEANK